MLFSSTTISSVASYTKMSETPNPPVSPSKEVTTTTTTSNAKKFEGDGVVYKGKLIGMEDLSLDRDEKICLDSMFKLKAVVRARGEHKQKIQLILSMSAVKIIDDTTKAQIASHEIERISFVVVDPRDSRAFGYIFNTANDRHQFWAIKTEKAAAITVLALKELFDLAFAQFTNTEKTKLEATKSTISVSSPPVSPVDQVVLPQEPPSSTVDSLPPPPPPTPLTPAVPTTTVNSSLLDGNDLWGESLPTTTTHTTDSVEGNLWDVDAPVVPVIQPTPKVIDPLEELFSRFATTQPPPPTNNTNPLLGVIQNISPPPAPVNNYAQFSSPITNASYMNTTTPIFAQQQPLFVTRTAPPPPLLQQQHLLVPTSFLSTPPPPLTQQQQPLLVPTSFSSNPAPSSTNPFTGFEILGDLSATKTTKESFFPTGPPAKTIQQLQMEKQRNPFARS